MLFKIESHILLWYSVYTIKCSGPKCTVGWLLTILCTCDNHLTQDIEYFYLHFPEIFLCFFLMNPPLYSKQWASITINYLSLFLDLFLRYSFMLVHVSVIHSFLLLVFYHMHLPKSVYPFSCWWMLGCSSFRLFWMKAAKNILVQVLFCLALLFDMFSFLVDEYLEAV